MARPRKAPSDDDGRLAYRPDEAAEKLGLSRHEIMRLVRRGELAAVKVPGTDRAPVLIPAESLRAFLAANPWAAAV